MSHPAIPAVRTGQVELDRMLSSIKQSLDQLTGQARNVKKLEPLAADATLAQVVTRLNQVIERLQ